MLITVALTYRTVPYRPTVPSYAPAHATKRFFGPYPPFALPSLTPPSNTVTTFLPQFTGLNIEHLRSPSSIHPDPCSSYALEMWAQDRQRACELHGMEVGGTAVRGARRCARYACGCGCVPTVVCLACTQAVGCACAGGRWSLKHSRSLATNTRVANGALTQGTAALAAADDPAPCGRACRYR